jgi:TonB-dependent starch-binding outer membrane protein SusC
MRTWSSVRATALLASLVALVGGPAAAAAQRTTTVQGTVTDSVGSRPIPGVRVVLVGTTRGALTDDAGRYVITGVPPGQLTLRAQRLGFSAAEQRVSAAADEAATADFMLRAVATVLSEVVVTGYGTTSRAHVTSAVAQVSAEAIANTPATLATASRCASAGHRPSRRATSRST